MKKPKLESLGEHNMENVRIVYSKGLCTGCGTCFAACPVSAIKIIKDKYRGIYIPEVNDDICTKCGLCLKVCPGYSVDFEKLNAEIFGKQPDDIWLGNYINCYLGHAKNYEIRYESSSGGLITALLVFALEKGIIDGALITRMKEDEPLEPEIIIAREKEDIISAMGSKYCPVPANIGLKEILKEKGKFAVVALPCHIQGLRKFEMINKELRDKIILRFGLMCSKTPTFLGTEYFLQKKGIKKENVKKIRYRGKGWLGSITILLKDGNEKTYPRVPQKLSDKILHLSSFHYSFSHPRCLLCCDHNNEFSDISFGDPRLPELIKKEKIGKSLVVSRTEIGEEILEKARMSGVIEIEKIPISKFFLAQNHSFKAGFNVHMSILKLLGKSIPYYNTPKVSKPKLNQYFRFIEYLPSYFSYKKYLWPFLFSIALVNFYIGRYYNMGITIIENLQKMVRRLKIK